MFLREKVRKLLFGFLGLVVVGVAITGCGLDAGEALGGSEAVSELPSEEQAEELPGFLAAAVPVEGCENLSEVWAEDLQSGTYTEVLKLGNNLLLVQMYFSVQLSDMTEDGTESVETTEIVVAPEMSLDCTGVDESVFTKTISENVVDAAAADEDLDEILLATAEETLSDEEDVTEDDPEGDSWLPDGYEGVTCYRFDLYSPEENAIIASLDTKDLSDGLYQVVGDDLLLINIGEGKVYRYDDTLTLVATYDISGMDEDSRGYLYPAGTEDAYYFVNDETKRIQRAAFSAVGMDVSDVMTDAYADVIYLASPDASKLLYNCIDAQSFRRSFVVAAADDLSVVRSYSEEPFYYISLTDGAFLACMADRMDVFRCNWFAGGNVYFSYPSDYVVSLLGDYVFAVENDLHIASSVVSDNSDTEIYENTEDSESYQAVSEVGESELVKEEDYGVYSARIYDENGTCVSAMDYPGDGQTYAVGEPLYFPEYDCALLYVHDLQQGGYLVVWDLDMQGSEVSSLTYYEAFEDVPEETVDDSTTGENDSEAGDSENGNSEDGTAGEDDTADDTEMELADGTTVTLVEDPGSYDWGNLATAREHADELAESYDVSIYLGPEVPDCIGSYLTEQCLDPAKVSQGLDALETILALYPQNLWTQLLYGDLRGIRIYLAGAISGQTEEMINAPTAYVDEVNHYMVMVLDTEQCEKWNYTANHEISHLIDRAMTFRSYYRTDSPFSEEEWDSYNPADFVYLNSYTDYQELSSYDMYSTYFMNAYGTTYATEDRAELFGAAVSHYLDASTYGKTFADGAPTLAKLEYYSDCIRAVFDTTGWPEVLPWEAVLKAYNV